MKIPLQLEDINLNFLSDIWQAIVDFLPKLLLVIIILLAGWIAVKIITYIVKKALRLTKIDKWADKLNEIEIFNQSEFKINLEKLIIGAVKWIVILLIVIVISDVLGLEVISQEIGNLIRYLPKLFSAIAIFMIGVYIASIIRNAVNSLFKSFNLGGSKFIGNIIFYVLVVIITITALNQAGVDTGIITNNLTLILGALLFAFTLAFGLGSKEIIQRLLFGFYTRKTLSVGDVIKIGDVKGKIEAIDNINLIVQTKDGKQIFPIKIINDSIIKIIGED
ncbi:MAG: mechanosensitive ion channel [Flavobacteriaceae bacterium]|nr:mechanosensitive ion channel [Flavobacteriaceae bacterium]